VNTILSPINKTA